MITIGTVPAQPGTGSDAPGGPGPHHAGAAARPTQAAFVGPRTRPAASFAVPARQVQTRRRTVSKRPASSAAVRPDLVGAVTTGARRPAPAPESGAGVSPHEGPPVHTGPVAVERQAPAAANLLPGSGVLRTARAAPDTAPNWGPARVSAEARPHHGGEAPQLPAIPAGPEAPARGVSGGRAAKMPPLVAKGRALMVAVRSGPSRRRGSTPPPATPAEGSVPQEAAAGPQVNVVPSQSALPTGRPLAPASVRTRAGGPPAPTVEEQPPPASGGWRISGLALRPPALGAGVQFRVNPPGTRLGAILVRMAASGARAHVVLSVRSNAWLKALAADRTSLASQLEPSLGRTTVEVTAGAGFGFGSSASDQADRPPPTRGFYGQGPEAGAMPSPGGAAAGLDLRA